MALHAKNYVHSRGSTHGLDTDRDEHWSRRGACAQPGVNPDAWFTGTRPNWEQVGDAIHICRQHCPVQAECFRDIGPLRNAVLGGYYFNDQAELSSHQPESAGCPLCDKNPLPRRQRLAHGTLNRERLTALVADGYSDSQIGELVGTSRDVVCKTRGRLGIPAAVPSGRRAAA